MQLKHVFPWLRPTLLEDSADARRITILLPYGRSACPCAFPLPARTSLLRLPAAVGHQAQGVERPDTYLLHDPTKIFSRRIRSFRFGETDKFDLTAARSTTGLWLAKM